MRRVTTKFRFYIIFIDIFLLSALNLEAQSTLDSFDPSPNNMVYSIAVQSDGKILMGGDFGIVGGQTRTNIARVNPDGSLDTSFNPNANGTVKSIVIQPDGKILVGGTFQNIGGQTRNKVARLNSDGTADSFHPSVSGNVDVVVLQPDGKVIIGGQFNGVNSQTRNRVARVNSDGSLDTAFNPNIITAGGEAFIYAIAVQSDGKILVGGEFTNVGTEPRSNIARLNSDGSLDFSFNPIANMAVRTIAIQSDNKILVGGIFTIIAGQAYPYIARINTNGSLDFSFNPNPDGVVESILIKNNGKILVGGSYSSMGGQIRLSLTQLNSDGTADLPVYIKIISGFIFKVAVQQDGKVLIGGRFSLVNGQSRNGIARFGFTPTAANVSVSGRVLSADGKAIARASVLVSDSSGQIRSVQTNSFGYYRFEDIRVGETYIFNVRARSHTFATQVVTINEELSNLDFTEQ